MPDEQPADSARARSRAMWDAGDYEGLTRLFQTVPESFIADIAAAPPATALDIGCGTGASAVLLARRGFEVTGLDLSPNMLKVARAKAQEQGLEIRFDEGVVEEMPYPDASFDVAVSTFAIMFSPDPRAAVDEVARVLKPGGVLAVANWTRAGFSMRMGATFARYMPAPPPGVAAPMDWGDPAQVRELLSPRFHDVETFVEPTTWRVPLSPTAAADVFLEKGGPPILMLSTLSEPQRSELIEEFRRLWSDGNLSSDPSETVVRNEFLVARARRR